MNTSSEVFKWMTDEQVAVALSALYDSEVRQELEDEASRRFQHTDSDLYMDRCSENQTKNQ